MDWRGNWGQFASDKESAAIIFSDRNDLIQSQLLNKDSQRCPNKFVADVES